MSMLSELFSLGAGNGGNGKGVTQIVVIAGDAADLMSEITNTLVTLALQSGNPQHYYLDVTHDDTMPAEVIALLEFTAEELFLGHGAPIIAVEPADTNMVFMPVGFITTSAAAIGSWQTSVQLELNGNYYLVNLRLSASRKLVSPYETFYWLSVEVTQHLPLTIPD